MKHLLSLLFLVFFTFSCIDRTTPSEEWRVVCTCEEMKNVKDDIKESILPSNNYSDEEMEDVISQLERTYINLNCPQRLVKGIGKGVHFTPTPDSCMKVMPFYY